MTDNHKTHQLPPVTVVIPAYNLASYLPDTIHSVLAQSYRGQISIIVLDDGSSDSTLQIANAFAEQHEQLSSHSQTNQGRAATRNHLLALAKTDLISWIDADDLAPPNWIEDQVHHLLDHRSCVAVGGQGYAITGHRRAIGPIPHPLSHHEIHQRHLHGQANAFFQSCVTVRKAAVLQAGGYDERFPCAEDYSLWLRLAEVGELRNLSETHLYYRVHATSANWTVNIEQRQQGQKILDEQRERIGLDQLTAVDAKIPPPKKDDWNRRIFWINLALKSGNPTAAMEMLKIALQKHPNSLLLWLAALIASLDAILFAGNRSGQFEAGHKAKIGKLPWYSFYRLARKAVRIRRQVFSMRRSSEPKTQ
ncbi:glycosyltransferase family 2 protein [Rhodopirellula sp.]|nr:glycosyltransferase family A protein [Rhodopirellula sp.]MDB4679019.1 glycosyltransferase family 2 protein [Rhodopirellula sp.]